jgi:Fic family protein
VMVDPHRVKAVIMGKALLQDRDEEEIRGYRQALDKIHRQGQNLPISEKTIQELHRLAKGDIWDAGKYKKKDGDIIERYPDGRERIRFKTVPAAKTSKYLGLLLEMWDNCLKERWVHPLVAVAAFNLDFLCIHPFRDGTGRVSRLLVLLQAYHLEYEVGRYISLERLIEENKERYYETLEISSQGWHDGRHDPWSYINFLLFIFKTAYREFEGRIGELKSPRGSKTEFIRTAVGSFADSFTLTELERKCPQISRDMVRKVLRDLQKEDLVESRGRGPGALWQKKILPLKEGKNKGN